jgi:hypothetical protein
MHDLPVTIRIDHVHGEQADLSDTLACCRRILSQRGYARHRGVALSAVQKAISAHRISTRPDGRIDSVRADAEWRQNTLQRHGAEDDDTLDLCGLKYRKARAAREYYQAWLAKLEYKRRCADLVRKDEVEMATSNVLRQFRDHMLSISDRVAAQLAAEPNPLKVHALLESEIRLVLETFAGEDAI